jgi:hypothetical protein
MSPLRAYFLFLICFCLSAAAFGGGAEAATRADQQRLLAAMQRAPTDYDITLQYVRVSTELEDYEAAIGALERLLFYNPDLSRAKVELGMLYFRMGSYENAAHSFRAAGAAADLDPALRNRVDAYLPQAEKQLSPMRWTGYLQTGLRYQSNVSALPDTGLLQVLGNSVPLTNASQKSDWNGFALVTIGNDYDLQDQHGDTIETRFTGYGTKQFTLSSLDLGYVEASIGPRIGIAPNNWANVSVKPYIVGDLSWIGGSQYLNSGGAGISLRMQPWSVFTIEPGFEWRRLSVNNNIFGSTGSGIGSVTALGSGDIFIVSIAGSYKINDWISIEARPLYARAQAFNPWQSFDQGGFDAGLRWEFAPPVPTMPRRWMVMPYVQVLCAAFDQTDPAVNPNVLRRDIDYHFGVLADMPINAYFGVSGMLQYARNDSNISNFRYTNISVMFGPNARF